VVENFGASNFLNVQNFAGVNPFLEKGKGGERKRERRITPKTVATTFATQSVCNAARAAHILRFDQFSTI
jgi:hypothetical protein